MSGRFMMQAAQSETRALLYVLREFIRVTADGNIQVKHEPEEASPWGLYRAGQLVRRFEYVEEAAFAAINLAIQRNQFVIASITEAGLRDALAKVANPNHPFKNYHEVSFLADHDPGKGSDPVRSVQTYEMRIATRAEIEAGFAEWENKQGQPLRPLDQLIQIGPGWGFPD